MLVEPPFNYTGSKFKLLPQLLPLFAPADRFIDLFAGGGSVYTNVASKYSQILVNDIIADLIEIQKKIIDNPDQVLADLEAILVKRDDAEGFLALRQSYNEEPTPEKLFMLMLSCTNNMLRFNKKFKFNQTFGKRTLNENTINKIRNWSGFLQEHKDKIEFRSVPFGQVECGEGDLLYIDPPYLPSQAGYNAYWDASDDNRLFQYLLDAHEKGAKFCISGFEEHDNQTSELMLKLAESGFYRKEIKSDYIKVSRKGHKTTREVVFTNYMV